MFFYYDYAILRVISIPFIFSWAILLAFFRRRMKSYNGDDVANCGFPNTSRSLSSPSFVTEGRNSPPTL